MEAGNLVLHNLDSLHDLQSVCRVVARRAPAPFFAGSMTIPRVVGLSARAGSAEASTAVYHDV